MNNVFFDQWIVIQKEYITYLKESFWAFPIYEIPWYDEELRGEKNIRKIVEDALSGNDVFAEKIITERESFKQTETGYQLDVFLPYADKSSIDLYQAATDIVIKLQRDALQEIKESFSEVPCFYVELQQQELRTLDRLRKAGDSIFGEINPDDILFKKEIYRIDNEEKSLKIFLPFADKEITGAKFEDGYLNIKF